MGLKSSNHWHCFDVMVIIIIHMLKFMFLCISRSCLKIECFNLIWMFLMYDIQTVNNVWWLISPIWWVLCLQQTVSTVINIKNKLETYTQFIGDLGEITWLMILVKVSSYIMQQPVQHHRWFVFLFRLLRICSWRTKQHQRPLQRSL